MTISLAVRRRIIWGTCVGLLLITVVLALLTFVDTYSISELGQHCTVSFWKSQWPKYLGCAMGVHADLAAGLVGGAGALWAAWLAFHAIQEQIAEEKEAREQQLRKESERTQQRQAEAKKVAVITLSRAVASAGAALVIVERAIASNDELAKAKVEKRLYEGGVTSLMEDALKSHAMRDISRELAVEDRIRFLEIVETLATIVSVCRASDPSPRVRIGRLLVSVQNGLNELHGRLPAFDAQLGEAFTRYSDHRANDIE